MTSLKKPFYSALVFFGTLVVLTVGYAAYNLSTETAGAPMTSMKWNNVINAVNDLDTRVSTLVAWGGNLWSTGATSSINYTAGNVGIWTVSPSKLLHLGTTTGNNAEMDIQSGIKPKWGIYHDETTEQLRFWNGSDRVTFSSGGNVGIGMVDPMARLDIKSTWAWIDDFKLSYNTTDFVALASMSDGYRLRTQGAAVNKLYLESGISWSIILNGSAGNVGIGTTNPGAKLDINAGMMPASTTTAFMKFRFNYADNAAIPAIQFRDMWDTASNAQISFPLSNGGSAANMAFSTYHGGMLTEDMRISNGNVGIGTTSPTAWYKLDVNGGIRMNSTLTQNNGTYDTYIGRWWGITGAWSSTPDTWTITLNQQDFAIGGWKKTAPVSWTGPWLYINSDTGNVGIGTTTVTTGFKLEVAGRIKSSGADDYSSDIRFKKDVQPLTNALEKITSLNGVSFDWRTDEFPSKNFKKTKDIGVIAQNVEKAFPELVTTGDDGYKSVAYTSLVAPL
ncbi:MAG: Cell wall surface anchor family protein, partial [uncultured bacterium (gcode 4)]